jgi:hypothetical protein
MTALLLNLKDKLLRLLFKSTIINLCFLFPQILFSQKLSKTDSISFRKDIEGILSKYGFYGQPYLISVQSTNQKGGQTAFIINNNFYGDTTLNESNFELWVDTLADKSLNVFVRPLKGVWNTPYIGIDTLYLDNHTGVKYDPGAGSIGSASGLSIVIDSISHGMLFIMRDGSCSYNHPMMVTLTDKKGFFTFGDFDDNKKGYLFRYGIGVSYAPLEQKKK